MSLSIQKISLIAICLTAVFLGLFLWPEFNPAPQASSNTGSDFSDSNNELISEKTSSKTNFQNDEARHTNAKTKSVQELFTEQSVTEEIEFDQYKLEQLGYDLVDDKGMKSIHPYHFYDDDTLIALSKANDPKASQIMGDRKNYENDFKGALLYYAKASSLGYTKTMIDTGNIYIGRARKATNPAIKEQLLANALTWFKLAEKNDDIQATSVIQFYRFQFDNLSETFDDSRISELEQSLYDSNL